MMRVIEAGPRDLAAWDDRVAASFNGTIFHRRRFLEYHGARFAGRERFLVILKGGAVFAQIALAVDDTAEGRVARSPYGASYGGIVFTAQPCFADCRAAVRALTEHLAEDGVERFTLTPPIACCLPEPCDAYPFALLACGYRSVNRDLSSVAVLAGGNPIERFVSSRARNMARKAAGRDIAIRRGHLDDFWMVMEKTFARHGTRPTHSAAEFALLTALLPDEIYVDVAYDHGGAPLAGIGYMQINRRVNSAFYLCQDPERRQEQALTLLILHALRSSAEHDFAAFDFGTSTHNMQPRDNIILFKESFSKAALFRETFEWRA